MLVAPPTRAESAPTITALSAKKGPAAGGTPVTITGNGLGDAIAVRFGTADAASYKNVSTEAIVAVSPPETSGRVSVTVETLGGASNATRRSDFTFGEPTITDVNPDSGLQAGGEVVTVTGSGFAPGATSFEFGKDAGLSPNCASTASCTVVTPAKAPCHPPFSPFCPPNTINVTATVATPTRTFKTKVTTGDLFSYAPLPEVSSLSAEGGPAAGGNVVYIGGSGFHDVSAVDFVYCLHFLHNDCGPPLPIAASFDVNSVNSITAIAPAGISGWAHVTVTTPAGTSVFRLEGGFDEDVYLFGHPTVTSIAPNHGPRAGGTPVTVTGSGFAPWTGFTFGGAYASDVDCASTTTCTMLTPKSGKKAVNVIVRVNKKEKLTVSGGFTFETKP